jgi:hypothetical protein
MTGGGHQLAQLEEALGLAEDVTLLTVRRQIHSIASLTERFAQLPAQIGIIFNDENSHGSPSAIILHGRWRH